MSEDELDRRIPHTDLLRLTTEVVSAYLGRNDLPAEQISEVIHTVFGSLRELDGAGGEIKAEPPKPAVSVRKSVAPDYIICLEDGKKLKMLKRHLRTMYNMSPDEYRTKWGLASDYPMVAPNYARQRSDFAKQIGLGRNANGKNGVESPRHRRGA